MTKMFVQNGLIKRNQDHARKNFSLQVLGQPGSVGSVCEDSGKTVVYIKTATMLSTSTVLIRPVNRLRMLSALLRMVAAESRWKIRLTESLATHRG
jgi:hypothetical protein